MKFTVPDKKKALHQVRKAAGTISNPLNLTYLFPGTPEQELAPCTMQVAKASQGQSLRLS